MAIAPMTVGGLPDVLEGLARLKGAVMGARPAGVQVGRGARRRGCWGLDPVLSRPTTVGSYGTMGASARVEPSTVTQTM
jgi:hypothetical protein